MPVARCSSAFAVPNSNQVGMFVDMHQRLLPSLAIAGAHEPTNRVAAAIIIFNIVFMCCALFFVWCKSRPREALKTEIDRVLAEK